MLRSACFAVCLLLPAAMVSAAAAAEKQADRTQTATAELAKLGLTDGDWPWWRGPQRNGWAAAGQSVPHRWSATENVRWKVAVPGRGHGSPTVVGDQVFLATADDEAQVQSVLCFNRTTGKQQWQTAVHRGKFVDGGHRKNSHASSSVACDGERIFINFLNDDAVYTTALNRSGKLLWQTKVADFVIHQGFGSSPAVYGSLVIVSADHKGGGAIVGLDRAAGEVAWKVDRPELPNYTSPMILHAAGRDQVILTGCDLVTSLDPLTGNKLWETTGATTECVTSAVSDGTRVFTTGGYPTNHVSAVAADGSKKLAWENTTRVYVPSLLARDGHLFAVTDAGVAICWKSATGEEVWKHRLSGTFSSSPVLVGDQIIAVNEAGRGFVFAADPQKFKLLGENQLGDEVFASPVVCGDRLYLRVAEQIDGHRQETLYCIGHPEERRDASTARD